MSFSVSTNLHQPPLSSCRTMRCSGLNLQFPGVGSANSNAEFLRKVNKSLQCGTRNQKPTRAVIKMMPIWPPRFPYKIPGTRHVQWLDVWDCLYRERIVFIAQDINEEFSNQILATMLYLDTINQSERMYFYINCRGGDLSPSLALYDTLKSMKTPLGTKCIGSAFNLAALILAAGEKGFRSAFPLSTIAVENPAGAAHGQADHIQNETNELLRIKDYINSEFAAKTGQPMEKIAKDFRRMKMLSAREAADYGLIDYVVREAEEELEGDDDAVQND